MKALIPIFLLASTSAFAAPTHITSTLAPWQADAFVAGWDGTHHRVVANRRSADGGFDAWWLDERSGATLGCITCTLPGAANLQRGASDVVPGGQWIVATIEKPSHPGALGDGAAEPGRGVYNDVYLVASDGTRQVQLTNVPADGEHGVIWARIDRSGTQIVWSEMRQGANIWVPKQLAGVWSLELANIVWSNGTPSLANVRTYDPEPGNFYEPYGFSPDGTQILFASSIGVGGFFESQLYRVSSTFAGLQRLTENVVGGPGWSNYNEFAFYLADGQHIVYGRSREASSGGLDYWVMQADGTHAERLTYLNEPWHAQSHGYSVVGGWAVDPSNPDHVLFSFCSAITCSGGTAMSMTLTSHATAGGTGLTGSYYRDRNWSQLAFSRVDAGVGFNWADAPDPRMPVDNFAIRWTGSVTARTSGWHLMCVSSDDGARLWVAGWLLVDAWHDQTTTNNCNWSWLAAGQPAPIQLDYYDAYGTNPSVKLSWIDPQGIQELVPAGQLFR
jgi:hypothetical protein